MSKKRTPIPKKVRFEILKRDRFRCRYCGAKAPDILLHIEHIEPVSKGGGNELENLVAACVECNLGKGARLLEDSTVIDKSREAISKAQEEIEQLEEMLRWRKEVSKKKALHADLMIEAIEDLIGLELNDDGKSNVLKAIDKYGFEVCADSAVDWVENSSARSMRELKQYSLAQYISFQIKRETVEGKKSYLTGIVRNRTSKLVLGHFTEDLNQVEINIDELERAILGLKSLHREKQYLNESLFMEWWNTILNDWGYSRGENN